MNFISLYNVSAFIKDDEGHNSILSYAKYTATGTLTTIIPFISLLGNNTLRFYTTSISDLGIHKLRL